MQSSTTTDTSTIGINNVREAHSSRCTPVTRRHHMVARHPVPAPTRTSAAAPAAAPQPSRRTGRRPIDRLTRRQLEVLSLMAEGHSNLAIARLCYISEKAVVQHTSQIYDRLNLPNDVGLHRRVQAVVIYLGESTAA